MNGRDGTVTAVARDVLSGASASADGWSPGRRSSAAVTASTAITSAPWARRRHRIANAPLAPVGRVYRLPQYAVDTRAGERKMQSPYSHLTPLHINPALGAA